MKHPWDNPWWGDACRLKVGLLKRPQPQVPHIPKGSAWEAELDRFAAWVAWNHNGRPIPRPSTFWKSVPWKPYFAILAEYQKKHAEPPPPPPPHPPPVPPASWTMPGPLILTASDPGSANGHRGVGAIGRIIDQIDACPLWECYPVAGVQSRGLCGQVEGEHQIDQCLQLIDEHRRDGDHLAVVSTLNVPAARLLAERITVCFYELNAQSDWEPYGNVGKLDFQAQQDGWSVGRRFPSYGCYDGIGLQDYRDYVPLITHDGGKTWVRADHPQGLEPYFAGFSAEGMTDTNSWPALP